MCHTLQKVKYIFFLLADNCVDLGSLFLFEMPTNKGDSVKFLAKFGKI